MRFRYLLLSLLCVPLMLMAVLEFGLWQLPDSEPSAWLLRNDLVANLASPVLLAATAGVMVAYYVLTATLLPMGLRNSRAFWQSAVFTGAVGILLLFVLQWVAPRLGMWWIPSSKFEHMVFWLIQLLSASYAMVEHPGGGMIQHLIGYTFGVGLAEEMVKLLPVLYLLNRSRVTGPMGAAVAGFASGVGFGVAEGILYSHNHYLPNGSPLLMYVVRFVSCAGSHGLLTAAAAVAVSRRRVFWDGEWHVPLWRILVAAFPSMLLHGVYNTLSTHGHGLMAASTDVVVFCWFVHQYETALHELKRPKSRSTRSGNNPDPYALDDLEVIRRRAYRS